MKNIDEAKLQFFEEHNKLFKSDLQNLWGIFCNRKVDEGMRFEDIAAHALKGSNRSYTVFINLGWIKGGKLSKEIEKLIIEETMNSLIQIS